MKVSLVNPSGTRTNSESPDPQISAELSIEDAPRGVVGYGSKLRKSIRRIYEGQKLPDFLRQSCSPSFGGVLTDKIYAKAAKHLDAEGEHLFPKLSRANVEGDLRFDPTICIAESSCDYSFAEHAATPSARLRICFLVATPFTLGFLMAVLPYVFFDRDHSPYLRGGLVISGLALMAISCVFHFGIVKRYSLDLYKGDPDIDLETLPLMYADEDESKIIASEQHNIIERLASV